MRINIPANVRVLDYLERCGIDLPAFCNGSGVCGRCRIQLIEGKLPITPSDRSFLNSQQISDGWRLACCAVTQTPVVIDESGAVNRNAKTADRAVREQHRYGLVLCGHTAALCDLTVVTVTGICTGERSVHELLERYPDAVGGVERCLYIGEDSDTVTTLIPSCEIMRLPHSTNVTEEEAVEAGIMKLFAERDQR